MTDPTDVSSTLTVKMDPATIGIASVNSSQPKVAQEALYTFTYVVKTKFLPNALIRIGI